MLEMIFEIGVTLLFIWFFAKVVKLAFKITWGVTKIIAVILFVIALPLLVVLLLTAGGALLLLPLALVIGAFALLAKPV